MGEGNWIFDKNIPKEKERRKANQEIGENLLKNDGHSERCQRADPFPVYDAAKILLHDQIPAVVG